VTPATVIHPRLTFSRRARLISWLFLTAAIALIPWIVFLGLTLPPKYDAGHWQLLWTGFDVALLVALGYAAWAAWFQRQILATTSVILGTLLLCDAWFDMLTSFGHRDEWLTLLTGFGAEIPLALFFFWLYRRIVLNSYSVIYRAMDLGDPPRHLRDAEILRLADEE
jgi:hypothetical protein